MSALDQILILILNKETQPSMQILFSLMWSNSAEQGELFCLKSAVSAPIWQLKTVLGIGKRKQYFILGLWHRGLLVFCKCPKDNQSQSVYFCGEATIECKSVHQLGHLILSYNYCKHQQDNTTNIDTEITRTVTDCFQFVF